MKLKSKWKNYSKKKKILTTVVPLTVVCALVGGGIHIASSRGASVVKVSTQEVNASVGTISNSIVGTGNLEVDDSIEITIPSGVTVKSVKVESGDAVLKGDTLAIVDKASVLETMNSVQEEMDTLDEEIENYEAEDETTEVNAKVSGTVKKVYAKKETNVTECIVDNGALLVIALDDGSTVDVLYNGGTVKSVSVKKGDSVSKGTCLMTIKNDEESVEYQQMIEKRKALAKNYKILAALSKNGAIEATADGTISQVNVSDSSSTSKSSSSSSTEGNSGDVVPSSSSEAAKATTLSTTTSVKATTLSTTVPAKAATLSETSDESTTEESRIMESETIMLQVKDTGKNTKTTLVIPAPKTGKSPVSEIQAEEGLLSGIQCSEGGKAIHFQLTFPATVEQTTKEATTQNQKENSTKQGESQTIPSESNIKDAGNTQNDSQQNSGMTSEGNSFSGGTSAVSTATNSATAEESNSTQTTESDSDEVVAFTMAGNDTMLITVSVDELDINSVAKGQEATVTLDAIEDQTFTGQVVKVGNSASSSGNGVAKYSVDISIPKEEQMKVGMNASATILVESVENVVTIPVIALQEKGNQSFVYTKKNSDGSLTGEVEVTTGLSDGTTVEITKGLSEGDVVYYQRIGNSSDRSNGLKGGNFDGMNFDGEPPAKFGGDSNMPQMQGQMPGGSK